MGTMSVGIGVEAPAERVFEMLCDLEGAPERIDQIIKTEVLTEGPFGVGTRWRETRKMFGKEATEEMEVVSMEPGRSYTVTAASCGSEYVTTLRCVPEGAGRCRVEFEFGWKAVTLGAKLMSPMVFFMKGMLRRCIESDLACIKRAAESG